MMTKKRISLNIKVTSQTFKCMEAVNFSDLRTSQQFSSNQNTSKVFENLISSFDSNFLRITSSIAICYKICPVF